MIKKLLHILLKQKPEGVRITGEITVRAYRAGTQELISESVTKNMIMQAGSTGLDLVIQRLIAVNTYSLNINYGEIGTGNTAVALTDVGNTTPAFRTVPSLQQDFGQSQAVLQFFFPDGSLTNQTYYEFATFVDGASGLGTGQVFNHALLGTPYVKSSGQDTTVQVVFTITQ